MAEQEPQLAAAAEEEEQASNYKAPALKSINEIISQDEDDESLQKYKQTLLAGAGEEEIVTDPNNEKNAVVKKLTICVEGREDIELDLTQTKEEIKATKIVLKEGCEYRVKIHFNIQREIVPGLRYAQKVYRKGITVEQDSHMVGSYAPKKEMYVYATPMDTAPTGLIARGDYKVDSRFTDDDKNIYLEWKWHFAIKKEWAE